MMRSHVLSARVMLACAGGCFISACGEIEDPELREIGSALTVTSLVLSPSSIAGGSGGATQATVTLAQAAPTGGALVTLSNSNTGLAASAPIVRVPQGATSATFAVATNALYRRYSGLAFSAVITASIDGTSASATLSVTAQPRPGDIISDSSQRRGTVCGGRFPAGQGDHGVLFNCRVAVPPAVSGTCSFSQECLLGCRATPASGFDFSDVCATSGPFPISVSPNYLVGGSPATGTLHFAAAVPASTHALAQSESPNATAFPTGFFDVPVGATTQNFLVSTSIVPTVKFVPLVDAFEIPTPTGGGTSLSNRPGTAWLTLAPPENPPAQPQPVLGQLTVDPATVTGGTNAFATAWLSGVVLSGAPSVTVLLTSSHPAITSLPASVTISPGSNVQSFTVSTTPPASPTLVTITASSGNLTVSDSITVTPAAPTCIPTSCAAQGANCGTIFDGCNQTLSCGSCIAPETCGGGGTPNVCGITSAAALTVTATGRSGECITSSPAGINVPVGSTGTATFNAGATITLSATNNRDVVWSGACSSSGARRKTCSFLLNANGAVTADVR